MSDNNVVTNRGFFLIGGSMAIISDAICLCPPGVKGSVKPFTKLTGPGTKPYAKEKADPAAKGATRPAERTP